MLRLHFRYFSFPKNLQVGPHRGSRLPDAAAGTRAPWGEECGSRVLGKQTDGPRKLRNHLGKQWHGYCKSSFFNRKVASRNETWIHFCWWVIPSDPKQSVFFGVWFVRWNMSSVCGFSRVNPRISFWPFLLPSTASRNKNVTGKNESVESTSVVPWNLTHQICGDLNSDPKRFTPNKRRLKSDVAEVQILLDYLYARPSWMERQVTIDTCKAGDPCLPGAGFAVLAVQDVMHLASELKLSALKELLGWLGNSFQCSKYNTTTESWMHPAISATQKTGHSVWFCSNLCPRQGMQWNRLLTVPPPLPVEVEEEIEDHQEDAEVLSKNEVADNPEAQQKLKKSFTKRNKI